MNTSFEQKAHDIQYRKRKPAHPHIIETYTGNNKSKVRTIAEVFVALIVWVALMLLIMAVTTN